MTATDVRAIEVEPGEVDVMLLKIFKCPEVVRDNLALIVLNRPVACLCFPIRRIKTCWGGQGGIDTNVGQGFRSLKVVFGFVLDLDFILIKGNPSFDQLNLSGSDIRSNPIRLRNACATVLRTGPTVRFLTTMTRVLGWRKST